MNRLYLITGLSDLNDEIIESLSDIEVRVMATDLKKGLETLKDEITAGDKVLVNRYLDPEKDGSQIVEFVKALRKIEPSIRAIILTADYERSAVQPLVAQGVYDWIIKSDVSAEDVKWAIERPAKEFPFELYEKPMIEAAQKAASEKSPIGFGGFSLFTKKEKVRTLMKETIVFWSPFSRGATTCAYHYAVGLADQYQCQTAVVSMDMFSPRLESVAGVKGKHYLQEALKSVSAGALTMERLQKFMTETSKNVDILPSSFSYDEHYYADPQHLKRLLDMLKGLYDFVVVDVNRYYVDKFTFTVLQHADRVLCPLSAVKDDLDQYIAYMREFRGHGDFKTEKFQPLINLYSGDCLNFIEVEQVLGQKPVVYTPKGKVEKVMRKSMAELASRR